MVEDEYVIAAEHARALKGAGAEVPGPAPSVARALGLVEAAGERIDAAWPLAEALAARGVPLVLTTGYDREAIPERHAHHARCTKPVSPRLLLAALAKAVAAAAR